MIKFVYFDLGGVFFEWDQALATAAKEFNLTVDDLIGAFNDVDEDITKGKIDPEEFWVYCQKKFHIKNGFNYDLLDSWISDYVPISQTYDFAKSLIIKYKIGIISNIYKDFYPSLIKKKIVPDITFDTVILSCDVGMRKPEPEIYDLAQDQSGVKPEEILFIDDSESSLIIPNELGWKTHLFDTYNPEKSISKLEQILS